MAKLAIKREEKYQSVKRQERMEEYLRQKKMEKLEKKLSRVEKMK